VFCYTFELKIEKACKNRISLNLGGTETVYRGFKVNDMQIQSFRWEFVSFVYPSWELVSFDLRQVTRSPPTKKNLFELVGITKKQGTSQLTSLNLSFRVNFP